MKVAIAIAALLAATPGWSADICSPSASFCWHEDFENWSNLPGEGGSVWWYGRDASDGGRVELRMLDGKLEVTADRTTALLQLVEFDGLPVEPSEDWSIRAKLLLERGSTVGVGVTNRGEANQVLFGDIAFRYAWVNRQGDVPNVLVDSTPIQRGEEVFIQFDAFGESVMMSMWGVADERMQIVSPGVPLDSPPIAGEPHIKVSWSDAVVWIDDVWVSDRPIPIVPEPSGLALGGLSLAASVLLCCKRAPS